LASKYTSFVAVEERNEAIQSTPELVKVPTQQAQKSGHEKEKKERNLSDGLRKKKMASAPSISRSSMSVSSSLPPSAPAPSIAPRKYFTIQIVLEIQFNEIVL
jgi:hypothetical protein